MTASIDSNRSSCWKLTSPIPADPTYDKYVGSEKRQGKQNRNSPIPKDLEFETPKGSRCNSPKPRIKPEALAIARSHQGKDLAYLFNPAFQVIPIGVKPTQKSNRDYNKENFRKIKQIQKANKEKQSDSCRQTPVKAVYKIDKYDHIQSKVVQRLQTPDAPRMNRSQSMSDIKGVKGSNKCFDKPTNSSKPNKNENKRPSSARVLNINDTNSNIEVKRPSSAYAFGSKVRNESQNKSKNHIARNMQVAKKSSLKRSPSLNVLDDLKKKQNHEFNNYKRGEIPKYLQTRQHEWKKEEEERIANIPDPTIPPGHSLMPEADRLKTLNILKKSQKDMMSELQALPVSRDTLRMRSRKDLLEKKLREIDTAMKIFSRPRVFVKEDD